MPELERNCDGGADEDEHRSGNGHAQRRVPLHELPHELEASVRIGLHSRTGPVGQELAGEGGGIRIALGRVSPERALGDGGQLRGRFRTDHPDRDDVPGTHRLDHLCVVQSLEGRPSRQQLVEHRPEAEHVAPLVDRLEIAPRLLRAHVRRRAQRDAGLGQLRPEVGGGRVARRLGLAAALGQPPVDDHRLAVRAHHHVGGLEVPVHHRPGMGVGHRLGCVDEVREELEPLAQGPALGQRSLERPAPDQLLGGVERAVRTPGELEDGGDARMVQLGGEPRLAKEPGLGGSGASRGLLRSWPGELLERDLPSHEAVERAPDD